jgi:hypothetical protein
VTTISHATTTISPANYHQKNIRNPPNPLKNTAKNRENRTSQHENIFLQIAKNTGSNLEVERLDPE